MEEAFLAMLVRSTVGEYRINRIVAAPSGQGGTPDPDVLEETADHVAQIKASGCGKFAGTTLYAEAGLPGLVLIDQGRPVCAAHFADREEYDRDSTWPLPANGIALIDIATDDAVRGKGFAPRVIAEASRRHAAEVRPLIAFIWWSNRPSLNAFRKAGWRIIGTSIEFYLFGRWRGLRIRH